MSIQDDQTQRYIRENAEVEHLLLTPFRWLTSIIRWVLLLTAVAVMWVWNNTGWLVNVGDHSEATRAEAIATLDDEIQAQRTFAYRATPHFQYTDAKINLADGAAMRDRVDSDGFVDAVCNLPVTGEIGWAFDTSPGDWSSRSLHSFARKSARMYRAYAVGVLMTTALRNTLSDIRHASAGSGSNLCGAHYDDAIRVPDAPAIHVLRSNYVSGMRLADPGNYQGFQYFVGLCLQSEEASCPLMYSTAGFHDLFDQEPPLNDYQVHAVDALKATATDEFWLTTAHKNGVHHDARVLAAAEQAREDVDRLMHTQHGWQ